MIYFRKISATVLLMVYILSTPGIREVIRIPQLAEHYQDHCEEQKNTSLLAYLVMHYIQEDGTDQDAEEDNTLPFKSAEGVSTGNAISFFISEITELTHPGSPVNQLYRIQNNRLIPSPYAKSVWRPPCVA